MKVHRPTVLIPVLVSTALLASACGSSDSGATSPTTSSEPPAALVEPESPVVTERPPTTQPATSSTKADPEETTTSTSETTTTNPGSALDFYPPIGTEFTVVGVRWDDDLNFRSGPGTSNDVLANVVSLTNEHTIVGLGQAWQLENSIWWKVSVDGTEAWASQRYLAAPGLQDSVFDEVAAQLGILKFETLQDMADAVAATRETGGPEPRVVVVGEPLVFETGGIITIDVLDYGDDALKGERLRLEAAAALGEGDDPVVEFFVLEGVERTILCQRGVSGGLCT